MKNASLLTLLLALSSAAAAQSLPRNSQGDQISANVPSQAVFAEYLERDLLAYFQTKVSPDVISVTSEMLREGPTQSGVAYPKFYLWVRVIGKRGALAEGAVRVAAVDGKRFEVTDFISAANILADPKSLASTFPAALGPAINARAAHP
jgi:hypothetical protein